VDYFFNEAVPLNQDVIITGEKTWERVNVKDDLEVDGTLNGYNINDLYDRTIYITGKESQYLKGKKGFLLL
jgi:hypothetical protein